MYVLSAVVLSHYPETHKQKGLIGSAFCSCNMHKSFGRVIDGIAVKQFIKDNVPLLRIQMLSYWKGFGI